jgi:hypothetical protein
VTRPLKLHTEGLVPPPDRGRLLTPAQVVAELMPEGVSERVVREQVYPRVMIARRIYFYEADVKAWLNEHRVERAS